MTIHQREEDSRLWYMCQMLLLQQPKTADRPRTNHNQMTSPSNTWSATLTLNTWIAVQYLCFECVWIVLNESLMESRFKPEMNCLAFSRHHSGISAGSKRGREPTHKRSGEKPSPSLTSEVAESQRPCSNKHTQTVCFVCLNRPVFLLQDKVNTVRTNTECTQSFRANSLSLSCSFSPSPPFLTSYSLFFLPPSFLSECLNGSSGQAEPQSGLCKGGKRQLWSRGKWLLWGLTPALCEGPVSLPHL